MYAIAIDIAWIAVVLGWIYICVSIVQQLNEFFMKNNMVFPQTKFNIYIWIAGLLILPNEQRFNIY